MDYPVKRRSVIGADGALAVATLAGCLEGGTDDGNSNGDEPEAVGSDGLVYAFASDRISILDPADGDVVDELTDEFDDEIWADPRITHGYGLTFAADESLAIVDMTSRTVDLIDVGTAVDTVQDVGDSGTGYTGRYR